MHVIARSTFLPATIDLPHSAYTRPSNCARPSTKRSTRPCRYGRHLPAMGPAASGGCTDGPSAAAGARVQGRGAATAASPRSAAGRSLSPPPLRRSPDPAARASAPAQHRSVRCMRHSPPTRGHCQTAQAWTPRPLHTIGHIGSLNCLPKTAYQRRQRTNAQHASPTAHNSQRVQLVAPPLTVKADGNVLV